MIKAVADTHAIIWYLAADSNLSARAEAVFDQAEADDDKIAVSSITLVEAAYLVEKGKIPSDLFDLLEAAFVESDSLFTEIPAQSALVGSLRKIARAAVPDMPDRIIAATAMHLKLPLISRDSKIVVSGIPTIW